MVPTLSGDTSRSSSAQVLNQLHHPLRQLPCWFTWLPNKSWAEKSDPGMTQALQVGSVPLNGAGGIYGAWTELPG